MSSSKVICTCGCQGNRNRCGDECNAHLRSNGYLRFNSLVAQIISIERPTILVSMKEPHRPKRKTWDLHSVLGFIVAPWHWYSSLPGSAVGIACFLPMVGIDWWAAKKASCMRSRYHLQSHSGKVVNLMNYYQKTGRKASFICLGTAPTGSGAVPVFW